jgi:dissimilatory sulfite reductase (desulfoviridin) alpha/beta subunit
LGLFLKHPGRAEWTTDQIRKISEVARKYGRGKIYTTTREGVYIPGVDIKKEKVKAEVNQILSNVNLKPAQIVDKSCKSHSLLNFNVCIGQPNCPKGLINVKELAEILRDTEKKHQETRSLPGDVRVAVSGCPNCCARPEVNDIGIHGCERVYTNSYYCIGCLNCVETCYNVALYRDGNGIIHRDYNRCSDCGYCRKVCPSGASQTSQKFFRISFGGRLGRIPKPPEFTLDIYSLDRLITVFKKAIDIYSQDAGEGERFSIWLERYGAKKLQNILREN